MQQFTVPQFIDVEPKIIGPITTRQFLILLVAAFVIFILYQVFSFNAFLISGVLVLIITAFIAFAKINGRYFHYFVLTFIQTFKKPGLRVWDHRAISPETEEKEVSYEKMGIIEKNFSKEDIAKLSLVADTKGKYKGLDGEKILEEDLNK